MVLADEDAVRGEILEAHRDELAQLLERFDGRVQMTLKVYYREDEVVAEALASEPKLAALRDAVQGKPEEASYKERVQLGVLLNKAIEERRANDGKEILERPPAGRGGAREGPGDALMPAQWAESQRGASAMTRGSWLDGGTTAWRAVGSGAHWQACSWALSSRALMSWPSASSASQVSSVRVRLTPKS